MIKHISIFALFGLGLAGCTVDAASDEEFAEIEEQLDASCVPGPLSVQAVGGVNYTSPQTYNPQGCYKGQVAEIMNLSPYYVGLGNIQSGGIYVTWADAEPGTKAACEASKVRALLFEKTGSSWVTLADETVTGEYHAAGGGWSAYCNPPALSFTSQLKAGKTYRVAFTGRDPSNATRKVNIKTETVVN
jgi:hypothetical protein